MMKIKISLIISPMCFAVFTFLASAIHHMTSKFAGIEKHKSSMIYVHVYQFYFNSIPIKRKQIP